MTTLKQLAESIEYMAAMDLRATPNAMFMDALETALIKKNICLNHQATKIVTRMKVTLSEFNPQNDDWKRIVDGYSTIISKLIDLYDVENVIDMANHLSINYDR